MLPSAAGLLSWRGRPSQNAIGQVLEQLTFTLTGLEAGKSKVRSRQVGLLFLADGHLPPVSPHIWEGELWSLFS